MDWLSTTTGVLGGIGLFLLGMRLMTDGLRVAAGRALRTILQRWTATRMRSVLSGALITSLVQSSSAVTVAVIGFANAGLLSLAQAVAVIYGSNIGTTVTGWLVALVGFHLDVKAFALPGIGIGMALRVMGGSRRLGSLGEALAGFGLFFLGIDVLRNAMVGMQDVLPVSTLDVTGLKAIAMFTLVGFVLTVLMQSSSAAIAIILTSVGGGVIPIEAGACLVIGANVGTTSTAAVAVIGATSNAKRVAVAHLAFNVMTGTVALVTLPLLLLGVGRFRQALGMGAEPASVVAGFHTLFNVLGVALMWPLTDKMVAMLANRFRTREEEEGRARYLDRNVLATPVLALSALGLELARLSVLARDMARASLFSDISGEKLALRRESLDQLLSAIGEFVAELQHTRLPNELGSALPVALRIGRYYAETAELAQSIAVSREKSEPLIEDLAIQERGFERVILALIESTAVDAEGTSTESASVALAEVQGHYGRLKDAFLQAGAEGRVPVIDLVARLDRLSNMRRMAEQMERGARYLWKLGSMVSGEDSDPPLALAEPSSDQSVSDVASREPDSADFESQLETDN